MANCTEGEVLSAYHYWKSMKTAGYLIFAAACFLCIFNTLVMLDVFRFISKNVRSGDRQIRSRNIFGMYMVFSWSSLIGLAVPRAGPLSSVVISLCLSQGIFHMFQLLQSYFGRSSGEIECDMKAALGDAKISMRSPPCCCCCICCPQHTITKRVLRNLSLAGYQLAWIAPITAFLTCAFIMDGSFRTPGESQFVTPEFYMKLIDAVSTLTAMYALFMLFRVSKDVLAKFSVQGKMGTLQSCLLTANLQPLITTTLESQGVIPCLPPLSSKASGQALHFTILIVEMTVFSVLFRRFWRVPDDGSSGTAETKKITAIANNELFVTDVMKQPLSMENGLPLKLENNSGTSMTSLEERENDSVLLAVT